MLADADLLALAKSRWMLPLMAAFAEQPGRRFVELLHRTGAPRDTLSRTLQGALDAGWLMRNLGHGHPLRPEYLLTEQGRPFADAGRSMQSAMSALDLAAGSMSRWGLPILRAVSTGQERFNGIARALAPATPRALSQSLAGLEAQELLKRSLVNDRPPWSRYGLTERGLVLAHAA